MFCKKSRSSFQRCSIKKEVLKIFVIFTGRHLCWSLFLITLQNWRSKKRLQHKCFAVNVNIAKSLRTPTYASDCFCKFQSSDIPRDFLFYLLKLNALTWQLKHFNLVGIFSRFWKLHHSWELNLLCRGF